MTTRNTCFFFLFFFLRFLFKSAVEQVVEQLSLIAKGRSELAPSNSLRCYGNLGAADLDLHDEEIKSVLDNVSCCYYYYCMYPVLQMFTASLLMSLINFNN